MHGSWTFCWTLSPRGVGTTLLLLLFSSNIHNAYNDGWVSKFQVFHLSILVPLRLGSYPNGGRGFLCPPYHIRDQRITITWIYVRDENSASKRISLLVHLCIITACSNLKWLRFMMIPPWCTICVTFNKYSSNSPSSIHPCYTALRFTPFFERLWSGGIVPKSSAYTNMYNKRGPRGSSSIREVRVQKKYNLRPPDDEDIVLLLQVCKLVNVSLYFLHYSTTVRVVVTTQHYYFVTKPAESTPAAVSSLENLIQLPAHCALCTDID